jgi:SAM-dependent methyltransferase
VKTFQDWRAFHAPMSGFMGTPNVSFVIEGIPMPIFARVVKFLHQRDKNCEIIAGDYNPEVTRWLDTFALRWPWGDCTVDPDGQILRRGDNYPEELWSGDVVRNREPLSEKVVTITMENVGQILQLTMKENAFFKISDPQQVTILGYEVPPEWWSRIYEYPWAISYVDLDRAMKHNIVADMGCGYEQRPLKDILSEICVQVYAVDNNAALLNLQARDNLQFIVADFTQRIDAIPDGSLDRVYCISVLEELTADRMPAALAEFGRCLKPGGLCILTVDVQYDMDKPTPICGGVDLDALRSAIQGSGLALRAEWDTDKTNAVVGEGFNLCCFHCVVVKT